MKVILVSDIFGINDSFLEIKSFIQNLDYEVYTLTPYKDKVKTFVSENEAYESFVKECGHEKYYKKLEKLQNKTKAEYIVSFSAGASSSWLLSSKNLNNCKKILCFYPTSIRNNYNITVLTQIKVFFAKDEKTYIVEDISNKIKNKSNTNSQILCFAHGFMNKQTCNNYDEFLFGLELIKNELLKIKKSY